MQPYDEKFILQGIEEYNSKIKINEVGQYKIIKRDGLKGIIDGYLYEKEGEIKAVIPELVGEETVWMRIGPKEIEGCYEFIKNAKGKVGILGLGLGYVVQELLKKKDVKKIVVYEISRDVIDLYYSNFKKNPRVKIIYGDAFKAKGEEFDYFFTDIYQYKLSMKVVEDYKKLINIHQIQEYCFFGMEHFLLSCRYEEIVWVYIPELWMDMAKDISTKLSKSGYINYYKQINEEMASNILAGFKEILNDGEE